MNETNARTLLDALRQSPRVLLLGQHFLATTAGEDPLHRAFEDIAPAGMYDWWLSQRGPIEKRAEILDTKSRAIPLTEDAFIGIRQLPWRCVFTTAIDTTPRRLLEVGGKRQVIQRFRRTERPETSSLSLFRLFGSVDRQDSLELPPQDRNALRQHRPIAQEMLRPVAELVGPTGRLFIEGWRPKKDWLRPRDLAPALADFAPSQVLMYGISGDEATSLLEDEDFGPLIDAGIITIFEDSLVNAVTELSATAPIAVVDERLTSSETVVLDLIQRTPGNLIFPNEDDLSKVLIGRQEWRILNESFEVILPLRVTQALSGTSTEIYKRFRRFLSQSPDVQLDSIRHFAFRRPILDDLIIPTVIACLREPAPQDHLVILRGQSGSGKTVMLSLLATELREAGVPVILARRGVLPPNQLHIDKFAQLIELSVKTPLVVIYDGLLEDYEYVKMSSFFASRGRKVLLVASAYVPDVTDDSIRSSDSARGRVRIHSVALGVRLSEVERKLLLGHLARFLPYDADTIERLSRSGYDNFFAILYHVLEPARERLKSGLISEIDQMAERFTRQVQERATEDSIMNTSVNNLQFAIREALGNIFVTELATVAETTSGSSIGLEAVRLVNAIMVAGTMHLEVPQTLALRILQHDKNIVYREALRAFQVIEVRTISGGSYSLGARQELEAKLWCEKRINSRRDQFELIRALVSELRPHEVTDEKSIELNFAVRLLQAIGPQGHDSEKMPDHFQAIADLVHELRDRCGDIHPRLLLVESNATRESVVIKVRKYLEQHKGFQLDEDEFRKLVDNCLNELDRAEQALDEAVEMVSQDASSLTSLTAGGRRTLAILHTERACVLGAQIGSIRRLSAVVKNPEEALFQKMDDLMRSATHGWRRALVIAEDNYQALDAACWITRERLEAGNMTADTEAELLAEWSDVVERYRSSDLAPDQLDKFDQRESELERFRGDLSRFKQVIGRMKARGSNAVYTLEARFIEQDRGPAAARKHLEDNCKPLILTNRLVLLLFYRLWWALETRNIGFFPRDHMTLRFVNEQWEELRRLALARLALDGEQENSLALFHLGWSSLQLGQIMQAKDAFGRLETSSLGSYRRGRSLSVISNDNGSPREFSGETRPRALGSRGAIWIDELRLEIPYSLGEFADVDARPGQPIGPFHIALNYRGAFAQPIRRFPKDANPSS